MCAPYPSGTTRTALPASAPTCSRTARVPPALFTTVSGRAGSTASTTAASSSAADAGSPLRSSSSCPGPRRNVVSRTRAVSIDSGISGSRLTATRLSSSARSSLSRCRPVAPSARSMPREGSAVTDAVLVEDDQPQVAVVDGRAADGEPVLGAKAPPFPGRDPCRRGCEVRDDRGDEPLDPQPVVPVGLGQEGPFGVGVELGWNPASP